ncbi:rhamnulokinase [Luteolibacter yonseiensis]|uniref:Rhamnulokinase n=1 Tax=Luteolibacter yonseiensis TaxID=1144680 RepID=A0A934R408_9BACT|nr:rhamnulokinase family protein [Luteolibacter yonseiensis]MBK1816462.1 rhamnulokinase [Luteolibacter yonseiensis]
MTAGKTFIAVDLGAGSGRVIAATTDLSTLTLEEVHRFDNPGTDLPGGSFWNVIGLYREILEGLRRAVARHGDAIVSIGIDTWACDFGLIEKGGELLGMPHQYRDARFEGMAEAMHAILPESEIYARTGIKTNFYNSSLHLLAELRKNSPALANADNLLFIPDLLAYWLTGRQAVERTNASTSQLLDAATGEWAREVIQALGLPEKIFGKVVAPGTVLGPVREEVAAFIGRAGIPVVASASHDTAAAVAGIPMEGSEKLWLSSGTWSIMGVETDRPITSAEALGYGFCNELGVDNTVRFLKNIGGLWLIQECKRQWELDGEKLTYAEMASLANEAESFTAFIDPDDAVFASPGEMPAKIRAWCEKSGQAVPQDKGQVLRVATESLALKYRVVYERIRELTGSSYSRLNAGGGGIQNELLSQATADALGIEVVAGPVEATSCGNVITQMVGTGELPDFKAGRDLIRRSFEFRTFVPGNQAAWQAAYVRFRELLAVV